MRHTVACLGYFSRITTNLTLLQIQFCYVSLLFCIVALAVDVASGMLMGFQDFHTATRTRRDANHLFWTLHFNSGF